MLELHAAAWTRRLAPVVLGSVPRATPPFRGDRPSIPPMRIPTLTLLPLLPLLAPLAAQQAKVIPSAFVTVEGNSTHTYPLGRGLAGMQVLIDAPLVTATAGVVTAMSFRANGATPTTSVGYTKNYKVTAWTSPVTAAAMTKDATANQGSATPTVVFNGPLAVPTPPNGSVVPHPFGPRFVFLAPYQFNGANGNLLLQLETADTTVPPTTWPVDAVSLNKSTVTGLAVKVANGCAVGPASLKLTTQAALAVVGGSLTTKIQSSTVGAFPIAFGILGGTNQAPGYPIDLTPLAMPGCTLNVEPVAVQPLLETAGTYPDFVFPIPNVPALAWGSVYIQVLGNASPTTLVGSVTSDAFVYTIGETTAAPVRAQSIFSLDLLSWNLGAVGAYHPVLKLEGVLP